MRKIPSLVLAAGLLVFSFAINAAEPRSQPPQKRHGSPAARPLVREGDFAMKLAAKIGLGNPMNEAQAEQMLAAAGVTPENGWISDYPVTPGIIAELNDALMFAASEGSLPVSYEAAQDSVTDLARQLNLPLPSGEGTQDDDGRRN